MRSTFITVEGIDGCGKSSIAESRDFVPSMRRRGFSVVHCTREVGGTDVGEALRKLLLEQPLDARTEAVIAFAARYQHLRLLQPLLHPSPTQSRAASGPCLVWCDRFTDSTYAYQGYGRRLPLATLAELERSILGDLSHIQPDLTLWFDVPPKLAAARVASRGEALDRFEVQDEAFFARVADGYAQRMAASGGRIRRIDANASRAEVQAQVLHEIEAYLARQDESQADEIDRRPCHVPV